MISQYYIPSRLNGIVECIMELHMEEAAKFNYFFGWQGEIIFRIGSEYKVQLKSCKFSDESNSYGKKFSIVTGVQTYTTSVKFEKLHYMSVVINPVAIKALFRIPANKLNDIAIGGEEFFKELNEVEEKLNSFTNFQDRVLYLEELFLKRLNETPDLFLAINQFGFLKKLSKNNYQQSTKNVERMLGYSKTQSFRLFNEWYGLSIGKFLRLMRFQNSLNELHLSEESLTRISYRLGYYDQAHFTRTFKEYTGITPKEYKKNQAKFTGQIKLSDEICL